ncbi:Transcription factor Pcc1 [Novymonas esmeraldas]|uniref:Transcription factor Pcc1 n=1 Tax=Novymonas esmeraldas TaxID=1808958 RepID=A0AAW0EYQ9_9TRYP
MSRPAAAPSGGAASAARGTVPAQDDPAMECSMRLPLPDAASASVLWKVLKTDPAVPGTAKDVFWWSDDPSQRTVAVTVKATSKRDLRSAVGSVLEQAKLVVRTLRVYPPTTGHGAAAASSTP